MDVVVLGVGLGRADGLPVVAERLRDEVLLLEQMLLLVNVSVCMRADRVQGAYR